jgi:hypothetical protein
MTTFQVFCPNGHQNPENTHFCGECGAPTGVSVPGSPGAEGPPPWQSAPPEEYPSSPPPLSAAPYYLPNLIAAIVASVGIIIGSIGTWLSILGLAALGGMDVPDSWGLVTLILGGVCGVALFTQLNWGRTSFSLRWAVPIAWAVLVAGVGCLAVALVHIATVNSFSKVVFGTTHVAQVGWGLWLVAVSSAILCVTVAVVAVQIGNAGQDLARPSQAAWSSAWRWAAIAGSAVVLLCAIVNAYRPLMLGTGNDENQQPAQTETVTAQPPTSTVIIAPSVLPPPPARGPDDAIPADAERCSSNPVNVPLNNSAAGTVTSCPFAENVRDQYVHEPLRATTVTLNAFSPVTDQSYLMTCTGNHVVTCRGGISAVVYIY